MSTYRYKKCAKCGASAAQDDSLKFHRFPKPGSTNILRATAWATYCWPERDWSSLKSLVNLHKTSKVLCGQHFQDSCFTDSSKKRLFKYSIPGTKEYGTQLLESLRSTIHQVKSVPHEIVPGPSTHRDIPAAGPLTHHSIPVAGPSTHRDIPAAGPLAHHSIPVAGPSTHRDITVEGPSTHNDIPVFGPPTQQHVKSVPHEIVPGPSTHRDIPAAGPLTHHSIPVAGPSIHRDITVEGPSTHNDIPVFGPPTQQHVKSVPHEIVPGPSTHRDIHHICIVEPPGLSRTDGKRPDGLTLVPWSRGKSLVWDATCVSTFAACHLSNTKRFAGAAAETAAKGKHTKYSEIEKSYIFVPFAVETTGFINDNR